MTDLTAIVASAATGDEKAWGELVGRYQRPLGAIGATFRLTASDTQDAVQMTWFDLYRNIARLRCADQIGGWLATAMRRNCLGLIRRREREQLRSDWDEWDLVDESANPERPTLNAERDCALWRAVDRLPATQCRLVRTMFNDPDWPYAQVASELSMAAGTIGPTRLRALRRLKAILSSGELDSDRCA
jgi:RNA polymerase sigma factor (sigma-70 family)